MYKVCLTMVPRYTNFTSVSIQLIIFYHFSKKKLFKRSEKNIIFYAAFVKDVYLILLFTFIQAKNKSITNKSAWCIVKLKRQKVHDRPLLSQAIRRVTWLC